MLGDFPPNSKVILLILLSEPLEAINWPTLVLPVKAILSTNGLFTRASPASPQPDKTCTTPGGNPASLANYAILNAVNGVFSEVLSILTQPVARHGPHFHAYIKRGKLNGIIYPQTPTGSFLV